MNPIESSLGLATRMSFSASFVLLVITLVAVVMPGVAPATQRTDPGTSIRSGAAVAARGGCTTTIGHQTLFLEVGQSLHFDGVWRTCETYDGHPVVIHAASASGQPLPR